VLDPAKIALELDHSAGFLDTKLFLESASARPRLMISPSSTCLSKWRWPKTGCGS
jgi:hypothetical protein